MADERWTAETEALVETGIHGGSRQCVLNLDECLVEHEHGREARETLTVLADAGLLLPVGGETREEWTAEIDMGNGWSRRPYITTTGPAPAPVYAADIGGYLLGIVKPKRKLRRTVHTGPWRPVTEEPSRDR